MTGLSNADVTHTVPVYDYRGKDLFAPGNIPPFNAKLYKQELDEHCVVVVAHTINTYFRELTPEQKRNGEEKQKYASLNILWVALLDSGDSVA